MVTQDEADDEPRAAQQDGFPQAVFYRWIGRTPACLAHTPRSHASRTYHARMLRASAHRPTRSHASRTYHAHMLRAHTMLACFAHRPRSHASRFGTWAYTHARVHAHIRSCVPSAGCCCFEHLPLSSHHCTACLVRPHSTGSSSQGGCCWGPADDPDCLCCCPAA